MFRWRALNDEDREDYKQMAADDKTRYAKELKEWRAKISELNQARLLRIQAPNGDQGQNGEQIAAQVHLFCLMIIIKMIFKTASFFQDVQPPQQVAPAQAQPQVKFSYFQKSTDTCIIFGLQDNQPQQQAAQPQQQVYMALDFYL